MQWISRTKADSLTIAALDLDGSVFDVEAVEAVAEMLRRIGSFYAPCPAPTLRRLGRGALLGLVEEEKAKRLVESALDALISYGDFLELNVAADSEASRSAELYLAPLRFVMRPTGMAFLIGVEADGRCALPTDLIRRMERVRQIRRIRPLPPEDLRSRLLALGLPEQQVGEWLAAPPQAPAEAVLRTYRERLARLGPSGEVPGLQVIDPSRPIRFYKGRWVAPGRLTGQFVGRRERRFGPQLWCYVELRNGEPVRLLDLGGGEWRGCDEAWYLQAAIDAENQTPQFVRVAAAASQAAVVLEFFSPVPEWIERRLDLVGEPVSPGRGLLAYRIEATESETELGYLRKHLWLQTSESPTD